MHRPIYQVWVGQEIAGGLEVREQGGEGGEMGAKGALGVSAARTLAHANVMDSLSKRRDSRKTAKAKIEKSCMNRQGRICEAFSTMERHQS